jgi:DNA-nicking Smr family endonuclease
VSEIDDLLFRDAVEALAGLEAKALWDAKLGPRPAPAEPEPPRDESHAEPQDPRLPHHALRRQFEALFEAGAGPEPSRVRPSEAHRVGESPLDTSPEPALARPRHEEWRDLVRGRRVPERKVDLHGKTVAEALALVRAELGHAREQGWQYLLVVTGRGRRSVEGAKLRPAVQTYLRTQARNDLLWFDLAPPILGGDGAFVLRVRRPGREAKPAE